MTNYLIIKEVLREADRPLSVTSIVKRAQQDNPKIKKNTVSRIVNKMQENGKVEFHKRQIGKRRIKLCKPKFTD